MGKATKRVTKIRQVRVSNYALQNVTEIIEYIAYVNDQPLSALKVNEALEAAVLKIANNPFAYKECEQIPTETKMYRRAVCLSWLIIYKITATEILILGIIHAARSPKEIKKLRKNK